MIKRALLVVDIQNDYFPGGKWTLSGMNTAADNAAKLVAAARKVGDPVIFIQHESLEANAPYFLPGSPGIEIHASVQPRDGESVVVKHQINSFRDTELKAILDRKGIKSLVVCGAMSHFCVDAAVRAADDFGYAVTLIHDACATHDLEFNGTKIPAAQVHAAFMTALGQGYATALTTAEFLKQEAKAA